jgi:glycosyltransferase 2 family protein
MNRLGVSENEDHTRSPRSMRRAALVGLAIGVPASLLFLWLAFRGANVDTVWDVAREADLWAIALAVAAIGAVYAFQAARWRRLAASEHPGLVGFGEMVLGAVACNNVLPGRLGELFRARWLAVAAPMPSGRALATVGLDRGSDVVALFAFLVVSLPFVTSARWVTRIVIGSALLIVLLLTLLAAARAYSQRRHRDRRERGRLRRIARDIVDTLAEPLGRRRAAGALALSGAAWGAFAVAVWLVARSIGIELTPLECVFVTGVLNLGVAIPSSPGFVGTYQWLAVSSLAVVDVAREDALAFSILLQASWYLPTTLVGGALLLFRLDWGLRRGGEDRSIG